MANGWKLGKKAATNRPVFTRQDGTEYYPVTLTEFETSGAVAAHTGDTSDAHAASAVSIVDAAGDFTATDVEGALAELQADHEADATALSDHLTDTSDAHDASAISFTPAGTIAATDVQAAIEEVASEAGGSHPDLAAHDTLGLATQAELDTHAAAADPHTGYQKESEKDAANGYLGIGASVISAPFKFFPADDGGGTQSATAFYGGTGAPNNANGANGDFYFRGDGGALTTIYHKRVGAWVGII